MREPQDRSAFLLCALSKVCGPLTAARACPSRPPTPTPLAWAICGDSPRRLGSARRRVAAARRTAGPPRKSPVRIIPAYLCFLIAVLSFIVSQ